MFSSQTGSTEQVRTRLRFWAPFHPFRALKRLMPRRLFGRSLIIIIAPVVLLQAVVTYAFFERHYDTVTGRMAGGVARDVSYLVRLERDTPPGPVRDQMRQRAADAFGYTVEVMPGEKLNRSVSDPRTALDLRLTSIFAAEIGQDISFDTRRVPDYVDVRVQLPNEVMRFLVPLRRVVASNTDVFIFWMTGSSLVLLAVAILFLRNQVKPIERLAHAAESFGLGRSVPDFKPYGAAEVRRAAQAFIEMRERIERYVQQRTEMLAGVSHDLKTPLTRLRLQIAMMKKDADTQAMAADIDEMEHMLNEYLDFARGEGGEEAQPTDITTLIEEAVQDASRAAPATGERIKFSALGDGTLSIKRNTLKRCLGNLIENALKYGKRVEVTLRNRGDKRNGVEICVEDDGPGIPAARREEAFRPFHRLDEGRNLQMGGVGLGLAIARDAARAHGGDIALEDSPLGGLRARLRIPG